VCDECGSATDTIRKKCMHLQLSKKAPKENVFGKEQFANDSDCSRGKGVGCGRAMAAHCNVMNSSDSRARDVPKTQEEEFSRARRLRLKTIENN
jgi:hypothetical protein